MHGALTNQPSANTSTAYSSTTRSGVQNRARPTRACRPNGPPNGALADAAIGSVQLGTTRGVDSGDTGRGELTHRA
ncbi:hypothetical protein GCM10023321_01260 [Pseudonocardia eucalypti]|uniref:Uncharacterized protein n=1 Tax=Pseudonocardia eucalypti TaxID=648755 RepID=A0ABP9PD12_9PSEU